MLNAGINRYKSVQVKTSTPGDLLILLFDGCFRFMNEAVAALRAGERGRAGEKIQRAHAILSELVSTLRPEIWPELCENLEAVYLFAMGHMVQANLNQSPEMLEEVISVLQPIREAFRQAVKEVNATGFGGTPNQRRA